MLIFEECELGVGPHLAKMPGLAVAQSVDLPVDLRLA